MSRIGKMPIAIPSNAKVEILADNTVTISGPLGTLTKNFDKNLKIKFSDGVLTVERSGDEKEIRSLHGLTRALLHNMVVGVTQGFKKTLIVNGVGFRLTKQGDKISMNIGYSKPKVVSEIPGITLTPEGNDKLIVSGIDKELVGQFASKIRDLRPVEPYHLYGIRYNDEIVIKKETKKVGKK